MRIDYPDGSFMLSWDSMRAWYSSDGELIDCEKKYTYQGYPAARAVSPKHTHIRAWLIKKGKEEIELLRMGILKPKQQ